jgi:hypothetical protein
MPDSSFLASAEPSGGELAPRPQGSSHGARAGLEPISPELVLVDPELARRARALLPEPVTAPAALAPTLLSDAPTDSISERRSFRLAVLTACCLLLSGAVTAIVILRAGSKHGGLLPSASKQSPAFRPTEPTRPQAPSTAARRNVVDVLMPIRPDSVHRLVAQRFGPAPVQSTSGQRCSWTWPASGLRLTLVARRGSCAQASLFSVAMWRRSWKTRAGLQIGSSVHQLRLLYPRSIRRQNGWWLLYRGESRVSVGGLYAHVTRGRVDEFWVA